MLNIHGSQNMQTILPRQLKTYTSKVWLCPRLSILRFLGHANSSMVNARHLASNAVAHRVYNVFWVNTLTCYQGLAPKQLTVSIWWFSLPALHFHKYCTRRAYIYLELWWLHNTKVWYHHVMLSATQTDSHYPTFKPIAFQMKLLLHWIWKLLQVN